MTSIIAAIIVIGILILVHEFGHFIVARLFNIKVLKFSIGFGPKLFGFKGKETEYMISAIPLGGYVKLHGDDEGEVAEEQERAFNHQTPGKKILVIFAGPFFNFILAFFIFFVFNISGSNIPSTRIGEVIEGYPAYMAGLRKNDIIKKINKKDVKTWDELSSEIKRNPGKQLEIVYEQNGKTYTIIIMPKFDKTKNVFGEDVESPVVGIRASDETIKVILPVHVAAYKSLLQVYELTRLTVLTVYKLITRQIPVSSLGGPIAITQMAGETVKMGLSYYIGFIAFFSVNLGVLNILPIPLLDGGHIVLYLFEAVTRRTISQKFKEAFIYVGIVIIVMLMVVVFYNDITRILIKK